jgi:nucleotide-binding universal stress UspA family protein
VGNDMSPANAIVQTVANRLWLRDQRQLRIADRLLSTVDPPRHRSKARRPSGPYGARWTGFRSILCAIDFSEQSRLALRYAAAIAARRRGTLRVVYVNDPLLTQAAAVALNDRELVARSAVALRAFVEATVSAGTRRALRITRQVENGNPTAEIMAAADAAGADLIVVGTHGLTGARRLLLGSTTGQLLRQTRIPVLAIPRVRKRRAAAPLSSWPGQRIVAAIELGGGRAAEVDVAAQIARSFNSSLVAVHVVPHVIQPAWLGAIVSRYKADHGARARRRLAALINRLQSRVRIDARVVFGHVADGLVAFALQERASLVVVALQGRRGSWLDRRGSIAYGVVAHGATPVLAYPAAWHPR